MMAINICEFSCLETQGERELEEQEKRARRLDIMKLRLYFGGEDNKWKCIRGSIK